MKLTINGKESVLAEVQSIQDVLKALQLEGDFFAVALNMNCIPRSQYASTPVQDKDTIEILSPMQGG